MHFSNGFWLVWIFTPMFTLESDLVTMITIMGQFILPNIFPRWVRVLYPVWLSQLRKTFHMDRFTGVDINQLGSFCLISGEPQRLQWSKRGSFAVVLRESGWYGPLGAKGSREHMYMSIIMREETLQDKDQITSSTLQLHLVLEDIFLWQLHWTFGNVRVRYSEWMTLSQWFLWTCC